MSHYDKYRTQSAEKDRALRYNDGKPKYSIIDLESLELCARVLEFGAKKYGRNNWRKGLPITEILDSMLRHIASLNSGELIDKESGLPHIGHIQCNAMFLGNINNIDDVTTTKKKTLGICAPSWVYPGE